MSPEAPLTVPPSDGPGTEPVKGRSLWVDAWNVLRRNRAAVFAGALIITMAVLVIVGPWLSPWDYAYTDWDNVSIGPDWQSRHFFGTDALGRDLFVRTLYGGRPDRYQQNYACACE